MVLSLSRGARLAAAATMLAACGAKATAQAPAAGAATQNAVRPAAATGDFVREERNDLLEFRYGWPAAVEAIPALRAQLARALETARMEALATAAESRELSRERRLTFSGHWYEKSWQVAGDTPALLSLSASEHTYAGGAHPNTTFAALLWDRRAGRPIAASAVLGEAALRRLGVRFCDAFYAAKAEADEGTLPPDPEETYGPCPGFEGRVLVPADGDGNGRFETLHIQLDAYEAGGYASGPLFPELRFETEDLAGINPAYREAFEAARR